ncbi:MAG: serine/threonine-protein kinase [Pseudomonadota bacterium]
MKEFGIYRVVKHLGDGAMGTVLLVESPERQRYALKLMHAKAERSAEAVDRFSREVRIALTLKHQNIVETFHGGRAPTGMLYLLTEYCPLGGLDRWLAAQGPIALRHALRWMGGVAEALEYAGLVHQVVHRDIKPANLLLDEVRQVKLADMGLAKRTSAGATNLTTHGSIIGALLYMSPEQADASHDLDARSDLYALGATFYHLLSGQPPFMAKQPAQILYDIREKEPRPLLTLRPELPHALGDLVQTLLAKKREDRPASASAVLETLAAIAEEEGVAIEVSRVTLRPRTAPLPFP